MIAYIKGELVTKTESEICVDNNGIGYAILVTTATLQDIGPIGSQVKLYIYMQTREDGISLFGFLKREEKALFEKLISVSGIGPKGGIAILSSGRIEEIVTNIAQGNAIGLSKVKGIGKKTAERIIVELRDKVEASIDSVMANFIDTSFSQDAGIALISLGFTKKESQELVEYAISQNATTLEKVIQIALKKSAK
ncbi:MAG: Holliday junction branch migration protein RuvA [Bacillota bacterium]